MAKSKSTQSFTVEGIDETFYDPIEFLSYVCEGIQDEGTDYVIGLEDDINTHLSKAYPKFAKAVLQYSNSMEVLAEFATEFGDSGNTMDDDEDEDDDY